MSKEHELKRAVDIEGFLDGETVIKRYVLGIKVCYKVVGAEVFYKGDNGDWFLSSKEINFFLESKFELQQQVEKRYIHEFYTFSPDGYEEYHKMRTRKTWEEFNKVYHKKTEHISTEVIEGE